MKILSSFILILLLSVVTLYSQIPRTISFQGVLADAQGNLVPDGNHQLQIVLYDQATNGNQVFVENQTVPVVKGIFNVIIGSVAVIPQSLSFDRAYFLGVSVDGGSELTPRTVLTSVPYALRAERANIAESLSPTAAVVTHVNNQSGDVTLLGGGGTTVTNNGNAFTIASSGSGGTGIQTVQNTDGTIAIQNPNGPVATIGVSDGAITDSKLATGQVVKSINTLKDDVTLTAGSNVTITPNGNALTIAATGGGSSGVSSINNANGALTLAASGGATVSTNGKIITINAGSGSGGTGIQGIQNTDNTLDITNPGGPTATINVKNQGITTTKLADGSVTNAKIPTGQVVKSINTIKDDVTLAAGNNVTITPSGNTLTIAASGGGTSPWATNGNNISNTNSGNVGIGTSNPTAKLDIANGYLRAQDGANTPPTSGQGVELVSVALSHIGYLVSYDRSASHFRELDVDGSPLVLNVNSGGNVGIGVTNPTTSKLEIAAQDGLMITGYEPFITLRDGNAGNARGRMQSLNGDIVFDPESFIGGNAAMVIKNTSGKVGIGTSTPTAKLHVMTASGDGVRAESSNGSGVYGISTASSGGIGVSGSSSSTNGTGVYGSNSGSGGIGVYGYSSGGSGSFGVKCTGNGCYTGSWTNCSDLRMKKDIAPLKDALSNLLQLRGVYYYWRKDEFTDENFFPTRQIGVIAQEVEPFYPELVVTDSKGYKSVDYTKLTPILLEAIKEQQKTIDTLTKANKTFNERLTQLEKRLVQTPVQTNITSLDINK